tara:strand:- start:1660 stop:2271 length:612 start_codon:yes stop_codon:yes gene_type:complete
MWYYNGAIIKTPKSMEISDVLYPRTIFKDSTTLTSLGIKAYREVTPDSRYYWNGSFTVNTSGSEVVGTYASTARDVATLKASMLAKANSAVASRHDAIDWYWSRAAKGGTAVSSEIQNYATALYSEHETIKTAINAISDLAGVMAYENKPHTETRKVATYNEDGSFKEYSGTTTATRHIDMCTHFTANPTDEVDPAFVSLVAD